MGCAQSRIENEESVSRCKERRLFIKEAVAARNAFAAAHSAYAIALKNTGAALSDFGPGEVPQEFTHQYPSSTTTTTTTTTSTTLQPPTIDSLPPPPPPLPDFSPSPLQRSASMPELPKKFPPYLRPQSSICEEDDASGDEEFEAVDHNANKAAGSSSSSNAQPPPLPSRPHAPFPPPPPPPETKGMPWDFFFVPMDERITRSSSPGPSEEILCEEEEEEQQRPYATPPMSTNVTPERDFIEPQTPPMPPMSTWKQQQSDAVHHEHAASLGSVEMKMDEVASSSKPSISLVQVLNELDEHFLKASECSQGVSKMLEANRMHYHSNFADNRTHIDHSTRVMRIITWNQLLKGIPSSDDGKDEFDNVEWETHATVLDKMLAWEKKLYDEVRSGELLKIEYQRKVALLNKQKKHNTSSEAIEKTKAAVSHLHTRYIVDMQSLDSTASEIQCLRDQQLYPKLVELVNGMAEMWSGVRMHYETQLKIVFNLRDMDISNAPRETTVQHCDRTLQLSQVVKEWHSQFQSFMNHQKEYIKALHNWMRLSIIPIESTLKEKVSSPPRPLHPPIQPLLQQWNDQLDKLQDDLAKSSILSFAAVIDRLILLQQDEIKMRDKCEETRKEYIRKARAFEDWYHKYSHKKSGLPEDSGGGGPDGNEGGGSLKDPVTEKKFALEALKSRLDGEVEKHQKLCKQVREKSLHSLKTHLPELFRAMSDFSQASSDIYKKLQMLSQSPDQTGN